MMDKAHSTGAQKRKIPEPPHPRERREPLPCRAPKATEEDPEALRRVQAILNSSSYRLAEEDFDFLARNDLRGVRLLIEYLKPELLMAEHEIRHTIVVFGGGKLPEDMVEFHNISACPAGKASS
jgi:hypothetical protein